MLRRIYNANDLHRVPGLEDLPQDKANSLLKRLFGEFAHYKYTLPNGDITDRIENGNHVQYILDGKIVHILFGEEYIQPRFPGPNIPIKRIEFGGEEKNWEQVDKLYFAFLNNADSEIENYKKEVEMRNRQREMVKKFKELSKKSLA